MTCISNPYYQDGCLTLKLPNDKYLEVIVEDAFASFTMSVVLRVTIDSQAPAWLPISKGDTIMLKFIVVL
jgi:hypothetical protein